MEDGPSCAPSSGQTRDDFTLAYLQSCEAECPTCGYNVHAVTAPRCPECGGRLEIRVVPVSSGFSRAWLTALVASGLGGGMGLLLAAVVVHSGLPRNSLNIDVVYFLLQIPTPVILLIARRWYVRMTNMLQWLFACGLAGLNVGGLLWIVIYILRI